jgi:cytochrome c553
MACSQCHGADGAGNRDSGFPRLAGLNAAYLTHELAAFAGDTRKNDIMSTIAAALTPDERVVVAAYYAALPTVAPAPSPVPATPEDAKRGERLALGGDWAKGLPACATCHGRDGGGVGSAFPALAGQPAGYLSDQLDAWREGKRSDDPLALMKGIVGKLSADDVRAMSAYYAGLPVRAAATAGAKP